MNLCSTPITAQIFGKGYAALSIPSKQALQSIAER